MKWEKFRTCLVVLGLLILVTPSSQARDLVVAIEGELSLSGILALKLEAGPYTTKAIRIYSEPSHTLLALVTDRSFSESVEGAAWSEQTLAQTMALASIITKLPEGQPLIHLQGRPEKDERIVVEVFGDWPDGSSELRTMADALVGSGDFSFSTYIETSGLEKAGIQIEHCCQGGSCKKQKCKECESFAFTCCLLPDCCWIECGHVSGCSCAECGC